MKKQKTSSTQQGFTVVELMVTLVIASLLIVSGYQLYSAVNLRSGSIRQMSEASNIGYDVLRNEASVYVSASNNCNGVGPTQTVERTSATLKELAVTIKRCKPFSDSNLVRATVIVTYKEPSGTKEVHHATYVASSITVNPNRLCI